MPDTLVKIIGILDDERQHDPQPNMVVQKFVVRRGQDGSPTVGDAIDKAMGEIFSMQAMIVIKDERKVASDRTNWYILPMHKLARVEFQTHEITGRYPDNPEGAIKQ